MLHTESGKDSEKGYGAIALACVIFLLAAGCTGQHRETEFERVARIRLQLLNDSAQDAQRCLEHLISVSADTLKADSMIHNYYNNGGQWLWVTAADTMRLLQQGPALGAFLEREARSMGFAPDAFFGRQIQQDIDHFRQLDFDSTGTSVAATMASLELGLSRGYVRYALGQQYGFVDPDVFNHLDPRGGGGHRRVYDIALEHPDGNFLRQTLSHAGDATAYLASLQPADSIYARLKAMLADDSTSEGRHRIICNMERRRWRHKKTAASGERRVFVNIPSQQLWAIRPDSVFSMRICCGAWTTKTPLLESRINLIQLNPEWRIPFTIVRDEVSRHGGDSAYFARHHYFIVRNSTGDTLPAKSVTEEQLRSGSYRVTQHSGPGNSLGRMIFRFPNQFDVYLHDTNNRSAFNAERRTISHGCVRVQRPFDLAMFLLPDADERLLDRMRLSIDMKPETEWGREYLAQRDEGAGPVRLVTQQGLPQSVPVQIDYYTLFPNPETGVWETWRDRYEYDKQMIIRLKPFL